MNTTRIITEYVKQESLPIHSRSADPTKSRVCAIALAVLCAVISGSAAEPVPNVESTPPPAGNATNLPQATLVNPITDQSSNGLVLNLRGAPLETVLTNLSESAGFIINIKPGTTIRGKVDVFNKQPLTQEEALSVLDTVLGQNNLAAIRNGRMITIVNRDEAKTQNVRVIQGGDPEKIPLNDEIVTQIIPVRFVEVAQLIKDIQPLISTQTPITANEAGNAIVITDTQANIHKVAEIIRGIDMGAEDFVELRVFKLANADPTETAD